jgi:peptide/nickel transport system substrate-binding protein
MKKIAVLSLFVLCFGLFAPAISDPGRAKSAGDNVLRITLLREPATLDAHRLNVAIEGRIVADLGLTLIAMHPDTGELVPCLATSWSVSDDGLTWTFHLRDDVWFHDGTPLTAEEYAWTINRILSLTGPESFVPQTILRSVTGANVVDQYTLELKLSSPDATLVYGLANTYLQPLSPKAVESAGDDYGHQPVGVGPFRLTEWVAGEKITLERNPDFTWGPSFTSGGPAKLDRIEYVILPDYDLALVELLDGRVDLMQIHHSDARQVLDTEDFFLVSVSTLGSPIYLALDVTGPPLDDLRIRQALNYAADREQMVSIVEYGYGVPQYGPVAPKVIGFWPGTEEAGYHYDLTKAKTLLADAGYELNDEGLLVKDSQSLSLTLIVPLYAQVPQLPQIVELISEQFRQVGIQVDAVLLEVADSLAVAADPAAFDMVATGVTWPEATFVLLNLYLSTGHYNFSHVNDPELDQLLLSSLTAVDPETSRQLLWDAQKRIIENAYCVPLYGFSELFAVNNRIRNYTQTEYGRWLIDTSVDQNR